MPGDQESSIVPMTPTSTYSIPVAGVYPNPTEWVMLPTGQIYNRLTSLCLDDYSGYDFATDTTTNGAGTYKCHPLY